MTSFTITVQAAPSIVDKSRQFLRRISWPMTTWPTQEATRSVAKSRSSHAIWCGDPPDDTSFDPACRRTSWERSSAKGSQCSSDRNERTVAPRRPTYSTSKPWPSTAKSAETPGHTHEGPAKSKNRFNQ